MLDEKKDSKVKTHLEHIKHLEEDNRRLKLRLYISYVSLIVFALDLSSVLVISTITNKEVPLAPIIYCTFMVLTLVISFVSMKIKLNRETEAKIKLGYWLTFTLVATLSGFVVILTFLNL